MESLLSGKGLGRACSRILSGRSAIKLKNASASNPLLTQLQTINLNCSAAGIVHAACTRKWFLTPAFSSSSLHFALSGGRLPSPLLSFSILPPARSSSPFLSAARWHCRPPPRIPSGFCSRFAFLLPLSICLHFVNLPGAIFLIGIRVNIRQPRAHSFSLLLDIIPLSPPPTWCFGAWEVAPAEGGRGLSFRACGPRGGQVV